MDHVDDVEVPRVHRVQSLVAPTDPRAERDGGGTHLPFLLHLLQEREQLVVDEVGHARVVQLPDVDDVGPEPAQRVVERRGHADDVRAVGALLLTA